METSRGGTCSVRIRGGGWWNVCTCTCLCAAAHCTHTHTFTHWWKCPWSDRATQSHELYVQRRRKTNPSSCILTFNFYFTVAYRLSFYNGRINHLESTISCEVLPNPGFWGAACSQVHSPSPLLSSPARVSSLCSLSDCTMETQNAFMIALCKNPPPPLHPTQFLISVWLCCKNQRSALKRDQRSPNGDWLH